MVDVYNNLPQHVVDLKSVELFQKQLTDEARKRCRLDDVLWATSFSARRDRVPNGPDSELEPLD